MNFKLLKLSGYKSYVTSGLIVLFAILFAIGTINLDTFLKIFAVLTGVGIASLKAAVGKCAAGK